MPIYAYQCDHCQVSFEVRASFREKEQGLTPACPACQSLDTHQVLTVGRFVRSGGDRAALASSGCGPDSGPGCCGR